MLNILPNRDAHCDEIGYASCRRCFFRTRHGGREFYRTFGSFSVPDGAGLELGQERTGRGPQPETVVPLGFRQLGRNYVFWNRQHVPQGTRAVDVPPPWGGRCSDQACFVSLSLCSSPSSVNGPWYQNRQFKPIDYPAPDGKLSFDLLTSVSRTGTNHAENQPVHLVLANNDAKTHTDINVGEYAGLLGRACPAGVYEYNDAEGGEEDARGKKFVINSQVR
jgi:hypothetical protein